MDYAAIEKWDDYMAAYEKCLSHTSSADAPWFIVPADDKENARLIVAQAVVPLLGARDVLVPADLAAVMADDSRRFGAIVRERKIVLD